MSGHESDKGVLVHATVEDNRLVAVHKLEVPVKPTDPAAGVMQEIEIPEVVKSKLEGDWTIPQDSYLIISLGVHRETNDVGSPSVRERLIVLDSHAIELGPSPSQGANYFAPGIDTKY